MITIHRTIHPLIYAAAALAAFLAPHAQAAGTPTCAPNASCVATRSFVATVTHFRTSTQGRNRVLSATVHFENKSSQPLTIGYVRDSGIALDELGNRYVVPNANGVRAIGEIAGTSIDPKFTLQPGEASDARFELVWEPGKTAAGNVFEIDLAVREIATAGDQLKLGAEHALHFAGLGAPVSAAPAAQSAPAAAPPLAVPAAAPDPCGDSNRCYNAGAFLAEVMQVQTARISRHESLTVNVRFRNTSDKPVILAYRSSSSSAVDNFGNAYYWGRSGTHDTSAKGIGYVTGRSADPQFVLQPGQTRSATFGLMRYDVKPPIGESYSYDVVIDELELLPGQQIRTARQNSISFANLTAGSFRGTTATTAADQAQTPAAGVVEATDTANRVIDLFNRLKKDK
jgi:hypothetical protein